MVKYSSAPLDAAFAALADPVRRGILAQLATGVCSVGELARPCRMSLPGVMKHLRVLEDAGLMATEKHGRVRRCRLVPDRLKDTADWLSHYHQFWEQQLDSLARYLETTTDKEEETWPPSQRPPRPRSESIAPSRHRGRKSSKPGPTRKR